MQTQWPYFPVFLKLAGRRVLVVGGGELALRKIRLLLRAGARIEAAACELLPELASLEIAHIAGEFEPRQLRGCALALAASDDAALNARVAAAAQALSIPVNVVDDGAASTYITPSIVDRAPLLLAISSGGAAPLLARRLRAQIEALLPAAYGRLASFLGRVRPRLKSLPIEHRRRVLEDFLEGAGAQRILAGDEPAAEAVLDRLTQDRGNAAPAGEAKGEVFLVGAGP
ncbi:MAG: siroheme synthase, partial [Hydrocarboniphaga effusa]|nr:siroheme synthase [Hydrocarboniphaga effusa]